MAGEDAPGEPTQSADEAWHADGLELGARLGRYELVRVLGAGGMGVVFEARDPELDRAVAVKVLRTRPGGPDSAGAARLRREGVTMARLAHPNVIRVYDVGVERGHVFVAMELVRGGTLADWLARAPRTPAQIIAAFVQAGRGLAAAHDAGLVHRDFKPQNVLVGDDDRVLVTDFGLARELDRDEATPWPRVASSSPGVTAAGEIVGTPAYMAPEQHRGASVDERADQFSFCVALRRALADPSGAMRGAPARVRAALARGLEADPARRFPSMRALLAQLEPPAHPARRWLPAAAAGAILAGGAAWILAGRAGGDDPCPVPAAQLDAVWGEGRKRAVRDRLHAIDPAQGAARYDAAARAIGPFTDAWRDLRVQTCKATRVEGVQSDAAFELRMRCLDRRLAELDGSLARVVAAGDAAGLDVAMAGLFQVTPVARCSDERHLARLDTLPADREQRRAVRELGREIERVALDHRAHQLVGLPARAEAAVAAARRLGHVPTMVAALQASANVSLATGADEAALAALRELAQVAATAQDSRAEAFAWITLVSTIGARLLRPDEARALVPAASAAIHRAGDPVDLQVELLRAEARYLIEGPAVADGLARLEAALALLDGADDGSAAWELPRADVLLELATARMRSREPARAIEAYERAIAAYRALYGADSSGEAIARHNIGEAYRRLGQPAQSIAAFREAARINAARAGDSPRLASNLVSIASALGEQAQWAEALETYQRAHAIYRRQVDADDVAQVAVLVGLAWTYEHLDRGDDAERTYDELLAVIERAGATTVNLPIALYNRGELRRRRGDLDAALADHRRAHAAFRAIGEPAAAYLVYPRVAEGATLVQRGDLAEGLAVLAPFTGGDVDPVQGAKARIWTGRALHAAPRDRTRGLAMVRAARAALAAAVVKDPEGARDLVEVDRWLAANAR